MLNIINTKQLFNKNMENNNQIKTSFYGSLSNTTDELKSQLLLYESTIENDPYLTNFTKSIKKEESSFQTHFNGFLSNTDDILKCTLISFESVYREDPYLISFKEYKKESIEEFLE